MTERVLTDDSFDKTLLEMRVAFGHSISQRDRDVALFAWQASAEQATALERERCARALEFAEYMAKSAEQFQAATDEVARYYVEDEEDPPQHVLDRFGDCYSGLRNDIYEFRKRAERATAIRSGQSAGMVTCRCFDDRSRQLCMDKDRCVRTEAHCTEGGGK